MNNIANAFRPYWAFYINNITTEKSEQFHKWLEMGNNYFLYSQIETSKFTINSYNRESFLLPIAQDCNRFGTAALESILKAGEQAYMPKSLSWIIIKLYYSAFYSGHLLLRLLGISLTQLEKRATSMIENIAEVYGVRNGITIEKGFYICNYSDRSNSLIFEKAIKTGEDGSHGTMWKILSSKLRFISNDLLVINKSTDSQTVSVKISELLDNLNYMGCNNGSWLSKIRNDINYKHLHGTWFPYANYEKYYPEIHNHINDWKKDPLSIELKNLSGKEMLRFVSSCTFLLSTVISIVQDMEKRCSTGISFHKKGLIALLNNRSLQQKSVAV